MECLGQELMIRLEIEALLEWQDIVMLDIKLLWWFIS
jgi:hypothetical protein